LKQDNCLFNANIINEADYAYLSYVYVLCHRALA
jgi:hypothetical protein